MTDESIQIKRNIERKVAICIKKANDFFDIALSLPTIKMNQRGRSAGTAYLQKHEVRFNIYMYHQSPEEFVNNVVPHEVAHLVVFYLYGINARPHGKEWQNIMINLYGVEPARTHRFDPKPPSKTFSYQCDCQQHQLSVRRHNRIKKGGQYICRECRSILRFNNES